MDSPQHRPVDLATPTRGEVLSRGLVTVSTWSGRWILVFVGAVLVGLVVREVWSILLPVLFALIVTTVLEPPARALESRLRLPPALAAATVLVGSLAALIALGFALAPLVAGQAGDIVDDATAGLQKLQDWVQSSDFVTRDQVDAGIQALQDRISSSGDQIAGGVLTGVGAATNAVVTTVVTLVLTFLFLKDGRKFLPWTSRLAGERAGGHLEAVLGRSWGTLGGYIRTQALVSLIDAVLIGAGLLIVGVPLAVPLAILTFIGGFIPIVGAFVAGGVAVLVALVSEGPTGALIVLGIVLAVQQIEGNVLSPWLQSKSMQLHPVVVLLSVTLGGTLFGIVGAFLAVPAAAVAAVVLRYLDEQVTAASTPSVEPASVEPPSLEP
ncbi:AI-2E family transporter [Nocardioides lianchengensis]|uniref:Predicted PurR-regulated permease PerM n=1 Tax=Nocardioides lianchengensis TaxID=1045774 RepID=A0A1G6JJD6_9ACTN|nr:AI-2E family transporter [Nocardioides lianchengensis]NYG12729.1 putative PurR-regulated permease PerM [Nocardioides lianchengensis]SDC18791.1 Predicted PurR-regulated permease PerM [Nocardioides lianchengensis]